MRIHETARIARGAVVYGDISVGEGTSIWYHAVVRADSDSITIGRYSNVQDNCTVHVDTGHPVSIGDYVTIGHGAVVHGCSIGDRCLIGMGAIILNDAVIEEDCIIGAGALIPKGKVIPKGSIVVGNPGEIMRSVSEEDKQSIMKNALHYAKMPFETETSTQD